MSGGRGKGGCNNKGRGRGGRSSGSTTNPDNTSRTELSHYTYQVGSAKQASNFITVNDYLVRYIKMNYEMGRDIGTALEDLSPFNFTAVKPTLGIPMERREVHHCLEDSSKKTNRWDLGGIFGCRYLWIFCPKTTVPSLLPEPVISML